MIASDISVLVPVYNRVDDLRQLLDDLDRQLGAKFEVVIVDDGSNPAMEPQFARKTYRFPIVWRTHAENLGAGAARNTAVEAASGKLLVFIDSDGCVLDPVCLREHYNYHYGPTTWPLPVARPFVLHGQVEGINHSYWGKTFEYSNWFMSSGEKWTLLNDTHAPMHNTSMTREAFNRVGYFDPQFRVAEDVDWCVRCREVGIPLVFTPVLKVYHRDRDTFRAVWFSYLTMGKYAVRVRRKHPASRYSFLFPKIRVTAPFLIPFIVIAMTAYIALGWMRRDPHAKFYVPGMLIANIAYGIGLWRGLAPAQFE